MQTPPKTPYMETGSPNKIEKVPTKVVIHTLSDVIIGVFHKRPRLRLIDDLVTSEPYLAITDAVVYDKAGRVRFRTKFLTLNREHIVMIIPWDDLESKQDTQQFPP
jgi:hypothetical protein